MLHDLRMELDQLKACQTQAVIFGLTGAGIMLGLTNAFQADSLFPILLLMPLLTLLPFWIIFFDKARTISRIIGFIRVQEEFAIKGYIKGMIGWETAMKQYWKNKKDVALQDITEANERRNKLQKKILYSTYWFTVYIVFWLFSIICIVLSLYVAMIQKDWISYSYGSLFAIILISSVPFAVSYHHGTRMFKKEKASIGFSKFVNKMIILHVGMFVFMIIGESLLYSLDYMSWTGLIFMYIFSCFYIIFLYVSNLSLWLFRHITDGRYSYDIFEFRWRRILTEVVQQET